MNELCNLHLLCITSNAISHHKMTDQRRRPSNCTYLSLHTFMHFPPQSLALCILTLVPFSPGAKMIVSDFRIGVFISAASILSNLCNSFTNTKLASFKAYCSVSKVNTHPSIIVLPSREKRRKERAKGKNSRPKQTLGPPLNPINSHPNFLPSHLPGLKIPASFPQISSRRCKIQLG